MHADIVCKYCSRSKIDCREQILVGIKQSERTKIPISDTLGELLSVIHDGITDLLTHLMRKELSSEMDL